MPPETIEKMRESQRRRWASYDSVKRAEVVAAIKAGAARGERAQGWRAAIEANRGRKKPPVLPAVRAKISATLKGHRQSVETRTKRIESMRKRWKAGGMTRPEIEAWQILQRYHFRGQPLDVETQAPLFGRSIDFLLDGCLALEIYGCYWHGCPKCFPEHPHADAWHRRDFDRMAEIGKHTRGTVIAWEHEISDLPYMLDRALEMLA